MSRRYRLALSVCSLLVVPAALDAQRPANLIRQEFDQAAREVPTLARMLSLTPGMTVADVGAGGGAMAVTMAKWLGPGGRVYATDVAAAQLAEIKGAVAKEGLTNILVLEGATRATNLPDRCCDAIFLRDVYHHLTSPLEFDASLLSSLKPGGRLAVMDFQPEPGSPLPNGVPENRGGHGIPPAVIVSELTQSGFRHVSTIAHWPSDADHLYLALFENP